MTVTVLTEASASAPSLTGTAGSLISVLDYCLVTTLGWTKPYSGTNLAAYKAPAGSNGFYLYVDDSTGQNARVRGYEAMTSISAGTNPFPTDTQVSGGLYVYKSNASTSAIRQWTFVSNGKMFYFLRDITGNGRSSSSSDWQVLAFGDLMSYKSGDSYGTIIISEATASQTTTSGVFCSSTGNYVSAISAASGTGHYIARAHTQIGTSTPAGKYAEWGGGGQNSSPAIGNGGLTYPSAVDGQMHLSPLWAIENAGVGKRGLIPGIWVPLHAISNFTGGDTFTGAGALAGRTFLIARTNGWSYGFMIETSDTWGT
jgi:hypothetical protein